MANKKSGAQPGNQNNLKHGHASKRRGITSTYQVWVDMRRRCCNVNHPAYKWYGARGITVCAEWLNDFPKFLADMGEKPPRMSLDRHPNNDGNYEPSNCRWATPEQQMNNTRTNKVFTAHGKTLTLALWSRETGIGTTTLLWRLNKGWPPEKMLSPPRKIQYAR